MFKIHKYIHIISLNKKMKQQMLGFNFQSVFFSEVLGQLPPRKVAPWIIVPKEISFYYFVSPNNCIMLLMVLKLVVYIQALLNILISMVNPQSHSLETCVWLLFMLLQDFFASARLHRVHKSFCYLKVQYVICVT